ncbi:hypothetical protein HYPBUDRAFT_218492 [Hyphopichia burtonii NRRL Y-1933]|uniref:Copper-fist domain-containing protein n=1 Tax=Hyphopichia burtonii NRRL Y-1933 TaxID=984485 RepID=A0A1E4RF80_9ASCO|nr:hypothetical protein HYPBUDRAFT_218492 [Hyphopichia burtonii NRRL Y-1933]ODV65876.1 hypothetical protein HYPBUDRAFT_218492 [Hyphopichia burtonii NRRL Y-1933]
MILIGDIKYSCIECIRGHRSSLCRHHARPLLQVRSKGRPTVHANGNPNHRIAVFAEEIDEQEVAKSPSPPLNGCANKKTPVVILKASAKQVLDLVSGQILGPYDEKTYNKPDANAKKPAPIISDSSFINSSSCCSNGVTKFKKSCCCNNKSKNINKSKILKTYIDKHLHSKQEATFQVRQVDSKPKAKQETFDVVSIPSCSIPGSCCCGDDCNCEGCVVHGNATASSNELSKMVPNEVNMNYLDNLNFNNAISESIPSKDLVFNIVPPSENPPVLQSQNIQPLPINSLDSYTNYLISQTNGGYSSQPPKNTSSSLSLNEEESPSSCMCAPEECDCSNCETHGIINGLKLDEFFNSQNKSMVNDADIGGLLDLIIQNNQKAPTNAYDHTLAMMATMMNQSQPLPTSNEKPEKPEKAAKSCCN